MSTSTTNNNRVHQLNPSNIHTAVIHTDGNISTFPGIFATCSEKEIDVGKPFGKLAKGKSIWKPHPGSPDACFLLAGSIFSRFEEVIVPWGEDEIPFRDAEPRMEVIEKFFLSPAHDRYTYYRFIFPCTETFTFGEELKVMAESFEEGFADISNRVVYLRTDSPVEFYMDEGNVIHKK